MQNKFFYYSYIVMACILTVIILAFNGIKIYDFASSEVVEGVYNDGAFIMLENQDLKINASSYHDTVYKDNQKVSLLHDPARDTLYFYDSKIQYFKSFIVSGVLIFTMWYIFFIFFNRRNNDEQAEQ